MSAIQPAALPTAATLLLAIEPASAPDGETGFEAQFSALLGTLAPEGLAAAPTDTPPQPAPSIAVRALRGGKDAATSGSPDGKILPEGLADLAAEPNTNTADTAQVAESPPAEGQTGQLEAGSALPSLLTLAIGPAQLPGSQQPADMAKTLAATQRSASAAAQPQLQARAIASTAPASATAAAVPVRQALPGETATLPPAEFAPSSAPAPTATAATPRENEPASPLRSASTTLPIPPEAMRSFRQVPAPVVANAATTPDEMARAFATSGGAEAPPLPATLQMLGENAATAATNPVVQQAQKLAEPAIPAEPALAATGAVPDSIAAAPAPASAASQGPAPQAPAAPGTPQVHDFAALVDKLVEARQAVQSTLSSQTVQASVQHAEFGRVSLNFQQDAAGMTVTFANPDPDLARAVQSLSVPAAAASTGSGAATDNGSSNARQDWQGGNAAASGQSQGQSQGQSASLQQRETVSTTPFRADTPDETPSTPSAPRNGIFA